MDIIARVKVEIEYQYEDVWNDRYISDIVMEWEHHARPVKYSYISKNTNIDLVEFVKKYYNFYMCPVSEIKVMQEDPNRNTYIVYK